MRRSWLPSLMNTSCTLLSPFTSSSSSSLLPPPGSLAHTIWPALSWSSHPRPPIFPVSTFTSANASEFVELSQVEAVRKCSLVRFPKPKCVISNQLENLTKWMPENWAADSVYTFHYSLRMLMRAIYILQVEIGSCMRRTGKYSPTTTRVVTRAMGGWEVAW